MAPLATGLAIDRGAATSAPDLADVRGQDRARRALSVAAAGRRGLLIR
jgi:predicted ATPase with chaperone activity